MTQTKNETSATSPVHRGVSIQRLHHHAFPVADQEVTRQFMEDLLGIPLVATWAEHAGGGGEIVDPDLLAMPSEWLITKPGTAFCHTFYELDDGGAVAFFQFDGPKHLIGPTNIYQHVALKTDQKGQDEVHERLWAAGIYHHIIDHGYVTSLYVTSPDGLLFEICVDPENVEEINQQRRASAREDLKRWLDGDHTANNDWAARPKVYVGRSLYTPSAS